MSNGFYNADNPSKAEINSFWSLWFLAVFLLGMGGLFAGIGLTMLVNALTLRASKIKGTFANESTLTT